MAGDVVVKLIEYQDREMLALQVADALVSAINTQLLSRDIVSIAVPGGTTPGPIFDMLSAMRLDWARVRVMLTDERWVPEDDDRSNTALLKQRLLTGAASDAQFVPFFQPGMTAEDGCTAAQEVLTPLMPLSLVLLGMGEDMHTASLFPGAPGLVEAMASDAPHLCPIAPVDQDIKRVTLSAPALRGALDTHVLITGDKKRAALERALNLPPEEAPIAAVLGGGTVHWAA